MKIDKKEKGKIKFILLFLFIFFITPVFAAPTKGNYEKDGYEEIFEGKNPQGEFYREIDEGLLDWKNDYSVNIIYKKKYKLDMSPMMDGYLPTAKFKIEVFRGAKLSGGKIVGGSQVFETDSADDMVRHIGNFKVGDIVKIIDISKAGSKGTLDYAHFDAPFRKDGVSYNMPSGLEGNVSPGGTKILQLKEPGAYKVALQTKIKEAAYLKERDIDYPIWSCNGSSHAWGKSYYGQDNIPWEGWSHFTAVTFSVEKTEKNKGSDMILKELDLIDPSTGKVLESFKRELNSTDPMNVNKQKIVKIHKNLNEVSQLKKGNTYKLRAKYQFISFEKGSFDITKPESMTNEQKNLSTKINTNKLTAKYAYDTNVVRDGVFDRTETKTSRDKGSTALKNLETAAFEWDYKVPENIKQYIRVVGMIPDTFKNVDKIEEDNWGVVYGRFSVDDIGLISPVELYRDGKRVNFFEPNKNHTVQFNIKHFLGNESVGLDSATNPKVKIDVKIIDVKNRILLEQTVQASKVLNPGGTIKIPVNKSFSSGEALIRACAKINSIHGELGYNSDLSNDGICADFGMVKNYSVSNLRAFPPSINFGKNKSYEVRNITLKFSLSNESSDETGGDLPSNPLVTISNNGKIVWSQTVTLYPGKNKEMSVTLPNRRIDEGDNEFTVVINPDRKIMEYKPGISNPYADNAAKVSIRGIQYEECQECMTNKKRTRNEWKEKWEWEEQKGTVKTGTFDYCLKWGKETRTRCVRHEKHCWEDDKGKEHCSRECVEEEEYEVTVCKKYDYDVPYHYCDVTYHKEWNQTADYYETYQIEDVKFRSKYTKDNNGGWVSVKNGGQGKIKAGYGFELQILTRYKTNRNVAPSPNPYRSNHYSGDKYGVHSSGYCNWLTRYPGVTSVESPDRIYLEMPYTNKTGQKVCYILKPTSSGPWYNDLKIFELPERKLPNGEGVARKIFVNDDAESTINNPHRYKISVATPRPDRPDRFYGYYPENEVGSGKKSSDYLHDCNYFYLVILPQDDIKTHIIQ